MGDGFMNFKEICLITVLLAASLTPGLATAQVSDSTRVYASLPAQIEILVPDQYKNLQLQNCAPGGYATLDSGVEVKSNLNWCLKVAGSTASGRMVGSTGSPAHELHSAMTVQASNPAGSAVAIPGSGSTPAALLTNVAPGDYSGPDAVALLFEQFFGWNDYADDNYQMTVTLAASPV
jgi:hypothetical protein